MHQTSLGAAGAASVVADEGRRFFANSLFSNTWSRISLPPRLGQFGLVARALHRRGVRMLCGVRAQLKKLTDTDWMPAELSF